MKQELVCGRLLSAYGSPSNSVSENPKKRQLSFRQEDFSETEVPPGPILGNSDADSLERALEATRGLVRRVWFLYLAPFCFVRRGGQASPPLCSSGARAGEHGSSSWMKRISFLPEPLALPT
jgi:hypothetical protein